MEYLVQINDSRFRLRNAEERDRVRAAIQTAVREGGGFVPVAHVDGQTEVLITASSSVRIDRASTVAPVAVIVPHRERDAEDFDYLEFELYGGH